MASEDVLGSLSIKDYNHAGKYSRRTAMRVLDEDSWTEIKDIAGVE